MAVSVAMVGAYHTGPSTSRPEVTDSEAVECSCPEMRSRLSLPLPGVPPVELRRAPELQLWIRRRSSTGGTPGRDGDSLDLCFGHKNTTASESVTFRSRVGESV